MINNEAALFGLLIVILLICTGLIVYSTMRLGISPMPSSSKAYNAILTLISDTDDGAIADFGSGWGNLVIRLAQEFPHRKIIGYELSLLPWCFSMLAKKTLKLNNLVLYRKDFYQADLSEVSVITCYLFPDAMNKLSEKLQKDEFSVNSVISNNFSLPRFEASKTITLDDFYHSSIYFYPIKKTGYVPVFGKEH